jgi:hypothetical protein
MEVEWGGPGQMLAGRSYYLDLPEWMQGDADGGVCKEVEIDAGDLGVGACRDGSSASSSTSVASSAPESTSSQEQEATGTTSPGQSSMTEGPEETIIWTVTFDDVTMTFTVADETSSSSDGGMEVAATPTTRARTTVTVTVTNSTAVSSAL